MAQVVVQVNDRPYTMQCSDGEERHLQELARLLDSEVTRIKESVGQVGDIRVLLMAGLIWLSLGVCMFVTLSAVIGAQRDSPDAIPTGIQWVGLGPVAIGISHLIVYATGKRKERQ